MELSKTYYAYQLTGNRVALRTLLGPLRSRMVGPWSDVVLEQQVGEDRRLRSVWQNVTRAFRNDPVAKSNASWRVTLPTWFAAYWADRAAVAGLTRRRPWRPPARSHVPRLPKRFRV